MSGLVSRLVMAVALQPSLPTHDRDLLLYAVGGVGLLVLGSVLIAVANRRKR